MRTLIGPAADGPSSPAYPWPAEGPWTRLLMLRTLDGGVAGADGRSGSVSSAADRDVLEEVRRLADAVVIGAQTMRAERYGPMRARPDAEQERGARGQAAAPVLVIVSGRLDLPWTEPVWAESTQRPIVATTRAAPDEARRAAERHAEVLVLPGERVDARDLTQALHDRGLQRVVCEGGPGLLAEFARARLVDEVCLSLSPRMPTLHPTGHLTAGEDPIAPDEFVLTQLLEHESFLFARYLRRDHAERLG